MHTIPYAPQKPRQGYARPFASHESTILAIKIKRTQ